MYSISNRSTLVASAVMIFGGVAALAGTVLTHEQYERIPVARNATGEQVAQITFSSDKKYETEKGVPLKGRPLICGREGLFRVNGDDSSTDQIIVRAGEEIAVTSLISWSQQGSPSPTTGVAVTWGKSCWPFVAFTPETNAKYIVVNERIGGKGLSHLWTGVGLQHCEVSVYQETSAAFERVETHPASLSGCSPAAP